MKRLSLLFLFVFASGAGAQTLTIDTAATGLCGAEIFAGKWELARTDDKFDGFSKLKSRPTHWFAQGMYRLRFTTAAQRFVKQADTTYQLFVSYQGPDWIFVGEGASLVMLIDGQRVGFEASRGGVTREVVKGGGVTETAMYPTTLEMLRSLANARTLEAKLSGETRFFEITPKQPELSCGIGRLVHDARR